MQTRDHRPTSARALSRRLAVLDDLDETEHLALLAEIEGVLAGRTRDIVLTGRLDALYRAASRGQRERAVRSWLAIVGVLNLATLALEWLACPEMLPVSLVTRGLVVPLVYAGVLAVWARPRPAWIEGASITASLVALMITAGVNPLYGGETFALAYLGSGLFAAATSLIIVQVSQAWTGINAATLLALYAGFGLVNPAIPPVFIAAFAIFSTFVVLSLVPGRRTMTLISQQAFLLALGGAIQAKALAAANDRLLVLAGTDAHTGLANRRTFDETAARAWAQATSSPCAFGIVLLDIDHFKRLNDTAGHHAGDRCLTVIARTIRDALGADGFVARYGGEEFIVLVDDASPRDLMRLAQRIRLAVEGGAHPHPGLADGSTVTVSIGVALAVSDGSPDGLGALVRSADAALYRAKAEGRNRCAATWTDSAGGRVAGPDRLSA